MKSFIILFTTILLFFIVHMSSLGVDGYGDFNHPDQHAMNAFFGPTNPYEHHAPSFLSTWFPINPYADQNIQSAGQDYYDGQTVGGYNNYGQFGGYNQQPHLSYDYAPNPPYSNGFSHQPISNGNFGRSHSDPIVRLKEYCKSDCKSFKLKTSCKKHSVTMSENGASILCQCRWNSVLPIGKFCVANALILSNQPAAA